MRRTSSIMFVGPILASYPHQKQYTQRHFFVVQPGLSKLRLEYKDMREAKAARADMLKSTRVLKVDSMNLLNLISDAMADAVMLSEQEKAGQTDLVG